MEAQAQSMSAEFAMTEWGAISYPGVVWESDYHLAPFVIIGYPVQGTQAGETPTYIGAGALIRSHTIIYAGCRIGRSFQTGHSVLVREYSEIGNDVSIGSGSIIEHHVRIGDRVRLHSNVFVPEFSVLEDDCWLGPNVVLTNAKYPRSPEAKKSLVGPTIEFGAKIGANATILPAVRVGRHALVGAGSVVTHDVEADTVVVGNPARFIKSLSELPYGK
jgi:acetyltransferase-like isoleucine patch superfamily enzyme